MCEPESATAGTQVARMPELPEVQTVVTTLGPHLRGRLVRGVRMFRDDYATPSGFDWQGLVGRRVVGVRRRAKRIILELDGGGAIVAHLGMTGRLTFEAGGERAKHTHVAFAFEHGELRLSDPRRFGRLHWLGGGDAEAGLGPEPLTMRAAELAERLLRTRRPVKAALLDQAFVAGLGNIYADEALFAAGIHPAASCRDLQRDAAGRLSRAIKTTLRRAIAAGGSSLRDYVDADGNKGGYQRLHRVYGRGGQPCRRCRATIERFVLAGRSTHVCPRCQPRHEPEPM